MPLLVWLLGVIAAALGLAVALLDLGAELDDDPTTKPTWQLEEERADQARRRDPRVQPGDERLMRGPPANPADPGGPPASLWRGPGV